VRILAATAAAVVPAALSGCGGSAHPARIAWPAGVGLVRQSQAVATLASRGDTCRAAGAAALLQRDFDRDRAAGAIPSRLARPLGRAISALVSELRCPPPATPPPPPPPTPPPKPEEKHHKHDKPHAHKKHGKHHE